jgi:hypothetical protein
MCDGELNGLIRIAKGNMRCKLGSCHITKGMNYLQVIKIGKKVEGQLLNKYGARDEYCNFK